MLQSLLNTLEDAICTVDSGSRLRTFNHAALCLLGLRGDELAGVMVSPAFAPGDVTVAITELLASGARRLPEACELYRKDGKPLQVSYTLDRVAMEDGNTEVVLRFRPLAESLASEIALRESEVKRRIQGFNGLL